MPYPTYRPSTPAPRPRPLAAAPPGGASSKISRASIRTIVVVLVSVTATAVSFWRIRDVVQHDRPQPGPYDKVQQEHPEYFNLIMTIRGREPERAKQMIDKDPWLVNYTLPDVLGTPLHFAAITDQPELVQYMIDHGGNVAVKGRYGGTPLHWAAWRGSDAAVRVLLDNGADAEARSDEDNATPLFWLARASREPFGFRGNPVATAEALLAAGASAETTNKEGFTATDAAGVDSPITSLLLQHGAHPPTTEPTTLQPLGPWGPRGGGGFGPGQGSGGAGGPFRGDGFRRRWGERERERQEQEQSPQTQPSESPAPADQPAR
jgi:hypothetical protein